MGHQSHQKFVQLFLKILSTCLFVHFGINLTLRTPAKHRHPSEGNNTLENNNNKPCKKTNIPINESLSEKLPSNNSHPGNLKQFDWVIYHYLLIVFISVLCYVNALTPQFVHDDVVAIVKNPDVISSESRAMNMFWNDFWGKSLLDPTSHKSYRPLCVLTFRLNYLFSGLDPYYYHVINITLHVIVCLLFLHLCRTLVFGRCPELSLISAAVFASHPVHTEAVTNISGRPELLASIFYLLSIILYFRSASDNSVILRSFYCVLCGGCAMLCKEQGITSIGVCISYEMVVIMYRLSNRKELLLFKDTRFILARLCFLLLSVIFLLFLRLWWMAFAFPVFQLEDNPVVFQKSIIKRCINHLYIYWLNLLLLFYPAHLSYDYQMSSIPLILSWFDSRNLQSVVFLLLICGLIMHSLKQGRDDVFKYGVLMLIVPFLPSSNLLFPVGFVIAERTLYMPSMGFVIISIYCVHLNFKKFGFSIKSRRILWSIMVLLLICRCIIRNQVWQSRESLFRSGVQTLPQNAKLQYNYANYLRDIKQTEDAIAHYKTALRHWPIYSSAHNNIGLLLTDHGMAQRHFRLAISNQPTHAKAHYNLANSLFNEKKYDESEVWLKRALDLDPHSYSIYWTLGAIRETQLKLSQAEQYYRHALYLNPHESSIRCSIINVLIKTNKLEEAAEECTYITDDLNQKGMMLANIIQLYYNQHNETIANQLLTKSLTLGIHGVDCLLVSGRHYYNQQRHLAAAKIFQHILNMIPDQPDATIHYSQCLTQLRRFKDAETVLQHFLLRHPSNTAAVRQLARVYGVLERHEKAVNVLVELLRLINHNDSVEIHFDLAEHYKDLKRYLMAFKHYQQVTYIDPDHISAHLNIAVIHHLQHSYSAASYHYDKVLLLQSDNRLALENRRKLHLAINT